MPVSYPKLHPQYQEASRALREMGPGAFQAVTPNPKPHTLNPEPKIRNPKPQTLSPKSPTPNPKAQTLNPKT